MNSQNRHKPVSIEDLLRIKRSEKPAPEFWQDWQARYTEKRREVMLQERPWWKDAVPRFGIAVARWYLPVGAAAVVALTFFAVREFNPTVPARDFSGGVAAVEAEDQAKAPQMVSADVLGELRGGQPRMLKSASEKSGQPGMLTSSISGVAQEGKLSPTERAIAANLAAVHALEPELAHSWRGRSFVTPVNVGNRALEEEPLANVSAGREASRAKTLGFEYQAGGNATVPAYSRQQERWISRLNEEQLYEAKSGSVGARGDRVLVRF